MTTIERVREFLGELDTTPSFGALRSEDYKAGYRAARSDLAALFDVVLTETLTAQETVLVDIIRTGQAVYDPQGFVSFLTSPLAEFGDRTALELIEVGEAERVLGALAGDYEGQVR